MKTRSSLHWLAHTWEYEMPNDQWLTIYAELGFDVTPAEPMVMYEKDGSGYPGSSTTAELCEIKVTEISGEDWTIKSPENHELISWFERHLLAECGRDSSYWETLFFARYEWPEPDYDDRED